MRKLSGLFLALSMLALSAATAGATSRNLGAYPLGSGLLVTNGRGYLATTGNGVVWFVDLRSGERRTVDVQPPCSGQGLSAGKLVVNCSLPAVLPPYQYASGYTDDLRTGARAELPPLTVAAFGTSTSSGYYDETYRAVGRRWAEIKEVEYHLERVRFLDLLTGAVSDGPGINPRLVADLDAPSGVRRLCSPLRGPRVPNPQFQFGLIPGVPVLAGRYAAAVYYRENTTESPSSRIELGHCGTPTKVVRRCRSVTCDQVVLDRRTLAWVETPYIGASSRIFIRSLRTGKTRRITRSSRVQIQLVRGELYVLMDGRLRAIRP